MGRDKHDIEHIADLERRLNMKAGALDFWIARADQLQLRVEELEAAPRTPCIIVVNGATHEIERLQARVEELEQANHDYTVAEARATLARRKYGQLKRRW